jgi:hypothetical protein
MITLAQALREWDCCENSSRQKPAARVVLVLCIAKVVVGWALEDVRLGEKITKKDKTGPNVRAEGTDY